MKNVLLIPILAVLFMVFGLSSCDKESSVSDDSFVSNYLVTTITGIVFDENHLPVEGAKISSHGRVKYTDANGIFVFRNLTVPKYRCFVAVEYNNHFSVMRSKRPVNNGVTRLDAHLIDHNGANAQTDVFTAGNAYTVNMNDGSSIDFAGGTQFVDQYGQPYTGNVTIRTSALDATTENYSRRSPAGDQVGMDDGIEMLLDSRTGIMVELSDDNGMPLNLDNNSTATMSAQIPVGLQGTSPGNIPVYYASTNNANNNREGSATENGGKYEHEVGHFSYWSTQIANSNYGMITCRVIDASGNIISGVRVQVGNAYGITGTNGTFEMRVPTGIGMDVAIRSLDFYGISVVSVQTAWTNGENRMVELQLPQNLDHVQGSIVDCDNNPVEAQVTLNWNSNVSSIYTTNGGFDLPTLNGNPPYTLSVHTADLDTSFEVTVNAGLNDLGVISICPDPVVISSTNSVRVDSAGTGQIFNYSNFGTSADGHWYENGTSPYTYIGLDGVDGQLDIYTDGQASVGTYTLGSNASCFFAANVPSASYQIENGTVNIIQYGPVGGIIRGTVDGTTAAGDVVHIEFEVVRSADVM